jgi:hypothetical protein
MVRTVRRAARVTFARTHPHGKARRVQIIFKWYQGILLALCDPWIERRGEKWQLRGKCLHGYPARNVSQHSAAKNEAVESVHRR